MVKNNDLKMKMILVFLAFCLVLTLSVALISPAQVDASQTAAAGSADDPLITLSYLNSVLPKSGSAVSDSYKVLELKKGQKLRAKTDSLELILRSGYATVVSPVSNQGIADLTWGEDLLNSEMLPTNHSILIPRADGRGINITSDKAFVMVRGAYEIY